MPDLLRRSASADPDVAAEAFADLDNNLFHQGGWICPAAPAALPFLLDLAENPNVHHRNEIVESIGRFVNEAAIVQDRFVDEEWPDAVDRALPRMLALLTDPDPAVRREATWLVSRRGLPAEVVVPALRERWLIEDDPVTRRDLVLAFGDLPDVGHRDVRALDLPEAGLDDVPDVDLHGLLDFDADPQLALAALHALAKAEPDLPPRYVAEAVAAIRRDDAEEWAESAWIGGSGRRAIARATGDLVRRDPVAAATFVVAVGEGGGRDERVAALDQAAALMAEWRSAGPALGGLLVERLHDEDAEVRFRAAFLLGCAPQPGVADLLAGLAGDTAMRDSRMRVTVGDAAVWALARLGDERCVPAIVERLTGPRQGFEWNPAFFGGRDWPGFWLPSVEELLGPLREHADRLLPAVLARLTDADHPHRIFAICRLLSEWGAAAASAVPQLLPLLDRDDVADTVARTLRSIRPGVATADLGRLDRNHHAIAEVGDLGPSAAGSAGRLRELAEDTDDWVRATAAYAHWQVTGDTTVAVPVLTDVARMLADGRCLPVAVVALENLGRIGVTAAPVAQTVRIARAVLDDPRRVAHSSGWRAFTEDERVRAAAAALV